MGVILSRNRSANTAHVSQLTANLPDDRVRAVAISPDGKYLAFCDETGLYLRQIDTGETHLERLPFHNQDCGTGRRKTNDDLPVGPLDLLSPIRTPSPIRLDHSSTKTYARAAV